MFQYWLSRCHLTREKILKIINVFVYFVLVTFFFKKKWSLVRRKQFAGCVDMSEVWKIMKKRWRVSIKWKRTNSSSKHMAWVDCKRLWRSSRRLAMCGIKCRTNSNKSNQQSSINRMIDQRLTISMAMTKTVSIRRQPWGEGGMPKGTMFDCRKQRVTNIKGFWLARMCPPSPHWDLLLNHKIECAFLLLIIFSFRFCRHLFVMRASFWTCRCACLIVLVLTSTDAAEGRYIKGDPLKGYYDFIITGKSLCIFLYGDKCVFHFISKRKKKDKWREDCDKCVVPGQFYPFT